MFKNQLFSVISLFDKLGYLRGEYDKDENRINKSFRSYVKSYLILMNLKK